MLEKEKNVLSRALKTFNSVVVDRSGDVFSAKSLEIIGKWMLTKRILTDVLMGDNLTLSGEQRLPFEEELESGLLCVASRSAQGEPMTDSEKESLKNALMLCGNFSGVSDSDDACLRVLRRELAELCGLDLRPYRLLFETGPIEPKYLK